jgi:hypothetical protein
MPFANSFAAVMQIPKASSTVGAFRVESSSVEHHPHGAGRYEYTVEIVVHGPGGVAGVRRQFKQLLTAGHSYFSAYGNPYQLGFANYEVESLGQKRYRIKALGIGHRFDLRRELERFARYAKPHGLGVSAELLGRYLEDYQKDTHRKRPSIPY